MKRHVSIVLIAFLFLAVNAQKFENIAKTPPMGWNSWNKYGCNVSESLIMGMADAMVSSGMKDAGYEYVVIDDCWQVARDENGEIVADKDRFPHGIKYLADYIHSKGLKFGIYSCAGTLTCAGRPAGRGHEYQDALTYARWGVDYLKYDWCNTGTQEPKSSYTTMRDGLFAAHRPIVFSICEWGSNKPWEWAGSVGHLWRTTGDITSCWDCIDTHGGKYNSWGVMYILDMQDSLRKYAGPGHWNDPDMLEVGNGSLTLTESRAHFSLWAMLAAPLIAGNDLRKVSKDVLNILTDKEVISIDQDSLGIQAFRQSKIDSLEIWYKPLKNGDWALCFFNRGSKPVDVNYDWKKQVIYDDVAKLELHFNKQSYTLRDLWSKKEIGTTGKPLTSKLLSHDVLLLRLQK